MTIVMADAPSQASILEAKARMPRHAVYRAFAHETVVLNLETGKYHGLNPTAGRMLERLEASASVSVAADILALDYDRGIEEIQRDLYELCLDLRARGLLEFVANGGEII